MALQVGGVSKIDTIKCTHESRGTQIWERRWLWLWFWLRLYLITPGIVLSLFVSEPWRQLFPECDFGVSEVGGTYYSFLQKIRNFGTFLPIRFSGTLTERPRTSIVVIVFGRRKANGLVHICKHFIKKGHKKHPFDLRTPLFPAAPLTQRKENIS
jgi:hypothetical protein